jgi:hypothetical protein
VLCHLPSAASGCSRCGRPSTYVPSHPTTKRATRSVPPTGPCPLPHHHALMHDSLAECPQWYCGEIRQKHTFHINLYCPKGFINMIIRYVSLNTTEKNIIPKPNIFTGTRTQDSFRVCSLFMLLLVSPCHITIDNMTVDTLVPAGRAQRRNDSC